MLNANQQPSEQATIARPLAGAAQIRASSRTLAYGVMPKTVL
jgi:hypothetical protein